MDQLLSKTQAWIKRNARPLECARWEYLFENGSKEQVIEKLAAFQNDDGGFGHGLEPDFTMPHSSAIATWTACQILMEVEADPDDRIVASTMDYLVHSYDETLGLWGTVTPEFNDYPHAPHWHYSDGAQDRWMYNPSVELAAYLVHWTVEGSEGAKIGWKVIDKAKERLFSCSEIDFHEVNNYQRLLEILGRRIPDNEEIRVKVNQLAEQSINTEPDSWGKSYQALPLDMIFSKSDDLYEKYEMLVNDHLRYMMESVLDEGVWDITWSWGQYEENFYIARQQWKGMMAINHHKMLREFG